MSVRNQGEKRATEVYSWGDNTYQQLGYKTAYTTDVGYCNQMTPLLIDQVKDLRVIQIAAGANHSMLLTDKGEVYCWGRNNCYQCGTGCNTYNIQPTLVEKLKDKPVCFIACGVGHSIALTEDNELYCWGTFGFHSFTSKSFKIPELVKFSRPIVKVACGNSFTMLLTSDGEVYGWGSNHRGELGGESAFVDTPKLISYPEKILSIDCGYHHTAAVSATGKVYTYGNNEMYQLGINTHLSIRHTVQVAGLKNIEKVVCGGYHTVAINEEGRLFIWGANSNGELGLGHTNRTMGPNLVITLQEKYVKDVYCGKSHTVVVTENNLIYGWGNNNNNQLQVFGKSSYIPVPRLLSDLNNFDVCQVACGENHTIILNESAPVSTYMEDFAMSLNNPFCSDVTFIVQGKKIYAHKFVLFSRCNHFIRMFNHSMKESTTNEINLTGTHYPIAYAFLEYLYTDKVNLVTEHLVELYDLANMYGVERLKYLCEQTIKRNITVYNAVSLYKSSCEYQVDNLVHFTATFILNNMGAEVRTDEFEHLPRNDLLRLLKQIPPQCHIDL